MEIAILRLLLHENELADGTHLDFTVCGNDT